MEARQKLNFVTSKQLLFQKTPQYRLEKPNAVNEGSFCIVNTTKTMLYFDFSRERVSGLLKYPGRLGMHHLSSEFHHPAFPGRCIPIEPGKALAGLITFSVENDPRCEKAGAGTANDSDDDDCDRTARFSTGLRVYERKKVGGGDDLYVNCPVDYPIDKELSWTVVLDHPPHNGCASLFVDVELRVEGGSKKWKISTKGRQQCDTVARWMI